MHLKEKDLMKNQRAQLFRLGKLLREEKTIIDAFCDFLPAVFHLNRIKVPLSPLTEKRFFMVDIVQFQTTNFITPTFAGVPLL